MVQIDLFNRCIKVIFKNEGGYIWHIHDPGGETRYGIARMFYPDLDIANLTIEQATEIYYTDYWLPMNIEKIFNNKLVLQIFDFGVNTRSLKYGFNTALKAIQRIVDVVQDGRIGPISIAAINSYEGEIVELYKSERKKYYFDLVRRKPHMEVFLKGWIARIEHTKFR